MSTVLILSIGIAVGITAALFGRRAVENTDFVATLAFVLSIVLGYAPAFGLDLFNWANISGFSDTIYKDSDSRKLNFMNGFFRFDSNNPNELTGNSESDILKDITKVISKKKKDNKGDPIKARIVGEDGLLLDDELEIESFDISDKKLVFNKNLIGLKDGESDIVVYLDSDISLFDDITEGGETAKERKEEIEEAQNKLDPFRWLYVGVGLIVLQLVRDIPIILFGGYDNRFKVTSTFALIGVYIAYFISVKTMTKSIEEREDQGQFTKPIEVKKNDIFNGEMNGLIILGIFVAVINILSMGNSLLSLFGMYRFTLFGIKLKELVKSIDILLVLMSAVMIGLYGVSLF